MGDHSVISSVIHVSQRFAALSLPIRNPRPTKIPGVEGNAKPDNSGSRKKMQTP